MASESTCPAANQLSPMATLFPGNQTPRWAKNKNRRMFVQLDFVIWLLSVYSRNQSQLKLLWMLSKTGTTFIKERCLTFQLFPTPTACCCSYSVKMITNLSTHTHTRTHSSVRAGGVVGIVVRAKQGLDFVLQFNVHGPISGSLTTTWKRRLIQDALELYSLRAFGIG